MTIPEMLQKMTDALEPLKTEIPELQIHPWPVTNPTPPVLDIYPDSPFQLGAGFGVQDLQLRWVVRARVSFSDPGAASELLYRMLDPNDPLSVEAALAVNELAYVDTAGSVEAMQRFSDDPEDILGAAWRVGAFL